MGAAVRDAQNEENLGVPLVIQLSPYCDLNGLVLRFFGQIERRHADALVTVVMPADSGW
jgi:hypothetical protein